MPTTKNRVSGVIHKGELVASCNSKVDYEITQGWSMQKSLECDEQWAKSYLELFQLISSQDFDEAELETVLDSIQTEDSHWNWFKKSLNTRSNEYVWFYIYAEGKPQGACLVYHPKESALCPGDIFYVEFVAVAPWNRSCIVRQRKYKNIGTILIVAALKYSIRTLGLRPGFSLHSLPQANGYYMKLEMIPIPSLDKELLSYFELPEDKAKSLIKLNEY